MRKQAIVTGLDIGSSKISAVTAGLNKDGTFTILAQVTQGSKGVSKDAVISLNDAVSSVSGVMKKLTEKLSGGAGDIYVNISGETIKGARSCGMTPLNLRGREITKADMEKCANVAGTIHLPFDREIVHRIVQRYSVDDGPYIKNPLGLYGSRLACEVYVITADVNHIQNILKCVNNAGYDVKELIFTGIADGAALLDKEDRETGVLLLDMGASLTEVCIFSEGVLNNLEVIPIGADDIKDNFKDNPLCRELLSRIGGARQDFFKAGGNIGTTILTGGMTFMDSFVEFVEEQLSCKARVGVAKEVKGKISSVDSMRLVTAIGLVRYACQMRKLMREERRLPGRITNKVVEIFNNYF